MATLDAQLRSLLTHDAFVRRIARSLVASPADVDDVVQETYWAAITSPPGVFDRPLVPWLSRVARNIACGMRRRDARLRERERRAAVSEPVPSTAALVEREGLRCHIVEAVLALPEPLRAAIMLRYFDGLPPRDIALRLGESIDVVKSRLKRALAALRTRIDGEDPRGAGRRPHWALLALARVPGKPTRAAAIASTSQAVVMGVAAMISGTKAALVAGMVVLVGAGVWGFLHASSSGEVRPSIEAGRASEPSAPRTALSEEPPRKAILPRPGPLEESPEAAGDSTVSSRAASGRDPVWVVGRLVREDGGPLAGVPVSATERVRSAGQSSSHTTKLTTGDAGEFRLRLDEPFTPGGGAMRALALTHRSRAEAAAIRAGSEPVLAAVVDLGRDLPAGETDLGPVTLRIAPLVAAGVVVDQAGLPVPGALVAPRYRRRTQTVGEWIKESGRLHELEVETDDRGAFEIRGLVELPHLTLVASKAGWKSSADVAAPPGASGLRLVLTKALLLLGRVLVDPGIPLARIVVDCGPDSIPSEKLSYGVRHRCELEPDGSFSYELPDPATVRVSVSAIGTDEPLFDASGFALSPGGATRDSRLNPLDLRGRLRKITVSTVDAADRPVNGASVVVEPRPGLDYENAILTTAGQATLFTTGAAIDLRVEATGFRPQRLAQVTDDVRVVLQRAFGVRVKLDGDPIALPSDFSIKLEVTLSPSPREGDEQRHRRRILMPDGIQDWEGPRSWIRHPPVEVPISARGTSDEVPFPEPGTYTVRALLHRKLDANTRGDYVTGATFPPVVIAATDEPQLVTCPRPTDAALAEVVKKLME